MEHSARLTAAGLLAGLFVIYNANGREIGTVDSQPAKFTAREIAVAATLTLDRVVAERPALAERAAFGRDRQGHFRSSYPLPPALIAAIPATLLHHLGLVDMDAPLATNLVAKLTASSLTAAAVTLIFLSVRRIVPDRIAVVTAIAIGLGTNYWAAVSQTLWQHECVAFGLSVALWGWLRPTTDIRPRDLWLGGFGLALAGAARPQIAPLVAVMLGWLVARAGARRAVVPALIVAAAAISSIVTNYYWFGHLLGGTAQLEAMHPTIHGVEGSINAEPWVGALGLLVSPSRGVFLFSPIVIAGLAGLGRRRPPTGLALRWLAAGVAIQYVVYSLYSVWWGGHTYGPRYVLDLLVPFSPAIALGLVRTTGTGWGRIVAGMLLAWSILVAGRGAFVYPNEAWNTNPAEVDREHHRLWEVRDSQLVRVFRRDSSPQNYSLFSEGAIRRPAS